MIEIWFTILSLMLTVYVVLDGWDFGAGAIHLIVAKTGPERRQVVAAIGPLWSWHEVWLVASGGVLFVAFPRILASAFSGFYLALFLVLWLLILRGISIEVGGHIDDAMWQSCFDSIFAVSNVLLAVVFGAAMGNVVRGVPLDSSGKFHLALFTDFGVRGSVGLLDWYTVSVGVFSLAILSAHGATYLTLKTEGPVHDRSERLARKLWVASFALLAVVSVETWSVRPELFTGMGPRPLAWLAIAVVAGGAGALVAGLRGRLELRAFAGSCLIIAGLLGGAAASAFPVMLHSTIAPEQSLTAYNSAAGGYGLMVALIWWPLALVFSFCYFVFILRHYRGKVRVSADTQGYY